MQLSEFTYIFLTLCIPFLIYIVRSTNPKKGFSILFVVIISANIFLIFNNFSQIGLFFLAFYLIAYNRKEKFYYLGLAFIAFIVSSLDIIGFNNIKNFVPILLISAVFSSMMIGHWFLVDPTINREGMSSARGLLRAKDSKGEIIGAASVVIYPNLEKKTSQIAINEPYSAAKLKGQKITLEYVDEDDDTVVLFQDSVQL